MTHAVTILARRTPLAVAILSLAGGAPPARGVEEEPVRDSWTRSYESPPPVRFHDILEADGTPFDPGEAAFIRGVTGAAGAR